MKQTGSSTSSSPGGVRTTRNPRCWKKWRRKANRAKRDTMSPVDTHELPWGEGTGGLQTPTNRPEGRGQAGYRHPRTAAHAQAHERQRTHTRTYERTHAHERSPWSCCACRRGWAAWSRHSRPWSGSRADRSCGPPPTARHCRRRRVDRPPSPRTCSPATTGGRGSGGGE